LNIDTAMPLALIERRLGPLRGQAWLIVEYCPGQNLAASPPSATRLDAVRGLFARLAAARIIHGDLKATNLLWRDDGICLVDLDAMRQHRSETGYRRAWRKDRERFLRNWPNGSELAQALAAVLPPA
jgi:hypothetical protein